MSPHSPTATGELPATLVSVLTQVAASIGQPLTRVGAGCVFQLDAPVSGDLDADLCFAFDDDEEGTGLRVTFADRTVVIEPGRGEPDATVRGSTRAFLDFFANRRSSQALFLDGEWRTGDDGGRGPREVDEIRSYVRALEELLPAPYQLTDAMRVRVRASADRLGDAFTIERRTGLTPRAFADEIVRAGRPVILQDAVPGVSWWQFERLRALFGDAWTHLSRFPDCSFAIGDCLDRITSGDSRAFKAALPVTRALRDHYRGVEAYLHEVGAPDHEDHERGGGLDGLEVHRASRVFEKAQGLLVAPADERMPAGYRATVWHRDWADNLLAELIGVKRVRLASPRDAARFALSTTPACHYNVAIDHSPIDPRRPGALDGVTVREAVLEPGDVLFIPCGWLHTVENLTASAAVNCWRIHPPECLDVEREVQ